MPILSLPDPPGNVLRSAVAKGYAVDKRNKDSGINKYATLLRDLPLIFASLTQNVTGIGFFTGEAECKAPGALGNVRLLCTLAHFFRMGSREIAT
jgi:hypothetical protein